VGERGGARGPRPALAAATADDDFDAWEISPIEEFVLDEI
jgi:hypothetical protein